MIGRVVSVKSKNTATVIVERVVTHPLYKKTYIQSKKYLVDDQLSVNVGDIVDFINCKPISKNKANIKKSFFIPNPPVMFLRCVF